MTSRLITFTIDTDGTESDPQAIDEEFSLSMMFLPAMVGATIKVQALIPGGDVEDSDDWYDLYDDGNATDQRQAVIAAGGTQKAVGLAWLAGVIQAAEMVRLVSASAETSGAVILVSRKKISTR